MLVSNTSGEEIHDVVVVDLVPDEVDVVGVPVTDSVDAVQLGVHRGQEDIVWIISSIAAGGEIELSWSGEAVAPGDLEAVNSVSVTGSEVTGSSESDATYLGFVKALEIERGKAPAPTFVQKTVMKRVPVEGAVSPAVATALPNTGAPTVQMVAAAFALIALGALLVSLSFARLRSR
ncbi:MAG: hypothetical protein QOK47_605, partial [Actinomycetota bacterium]|nr:hypothetical protein [Actinomycetota bacterium]